MTRIAFDLGTTTLAGRLFDSTGEILAEAQTPNPQVEAGADVLARLQTAHQGEGDRLQALLVDGLRQLVDALCGAAHSEVVAVVAAANPAISCLLQNLPVESLLFPPHKPPYKELTQIPPAELDLGLNCPLTLFPLVSGFVGGDLIACLLALDAPEPGTLLIDVGTNAELALYDGVRWWVSSAAAGPAFEGGNISCGMLLADGAVTHVGIDGDRLQLSVVGDTAPKGLCGSGLAALIACGREGGLIDAAGRILAPDEVETNLGRYLLRQDKAWIIRFYRSAVSELALTQQDVRHFQLAKGAVLAGVELLLERGGFTVENLSKVILTGALGQSLPLPVLKSVALLPEAMLDKTSFVANGVLAGLESYLDGADSQRRLESLLGKIQPFPLSGTPAFEKLFLASLEF